MVYYCLLLRLRYVGHDEDTDDMNMKQADAERPEDVERSVSRIKNVCTFEVVGFRDFE